MAQVWRDGLKDQDLDLDRDWDGRKGGGNGDRNKKKIFFLGAIGIGIGVGRTVGDQTPPTHPTLMLFFRLQPTNQPPFLIAFGIRESRSQSRFRLSYDI